MTDETQNVATTTPPMVPATGGPGFDIVPMWKAAEGLSRSTLMPKAFRNEPANCFLALEIASRLGLGAFEVAQNLYIVHGEPAWKATYLIGLANARGPFKGSLQFNATGTGATQAVECWAIHRETGERVSATVSMAQAKKAKWTSNPKYDEIPVQMLSYRAATFLVRLYCPEVTLGMKTTEEVIDIAHGGPTTIDVAAGPADDLNKAVEVKKEDLDEKRAVDEKAQDLADKLGVDVETGEVKEKDGFWDE